ncbi:MAG: hypothetical protein IKW67_02505 [Alphaproteobacteria bacterium]|nr:hypothetical protein [Alphaproteobacteria bacterium]
MSLKKRLFFILVATAPFTASALEYDMGKLSLRLTGFGTFGFIEPDLETPLSIGDWRLRGQATYEITDDKKIGAVYAMDESALDKGNFSREVFAYLESRTMGRIEVGFTDSVARKLGVGLPDVGGLRINDKPIYNEKILPNGAIIADTAINAGRSNSLRLNLVSAPINSVQYGFSVAGITDKYDWATDFGMKIRKPSGKVKTAYSLGLSFMGNPRDFDSEVYTAGVTSDWRAQMSMGMNLQYNSWIWGLTGRVIYDKDPIGEISDGFVVGTGVSYDLLKYSVSLTYMLSDTGVWQDNVADFIDHTVVASFRYKYTENLDCWMSGGMTSRTPFFSVGLRLTF